MHPLYFFVSNAQIQSSESREHIEVCPDGAVLIQEIANRVEIDGGLALIADYGHTGNKSDTFRVIKLFSFIFISYSCIYLGLLILSN